MPENKGWKSASVGSRWGKTWRRVGTLCLHCLWFNPDPNFRPANEQPPHAIPPL